VFCVLFCALSPLLFSCSFFTCFHPVVDFVQPLPEGQSLKTPLQQKSASGFTSSSGNVIFGVGTSFSVKFNFFQPEAEGFTKKRLDQLKCKLVGTTMLHFDLTIVHETKESSKAQFSRPTVQDAHLDQLATLEKDWFTTTKLTNAASPLSKYHIGDGVATSTSSFDSAFRGTIGNHHDEIRAIGEVKHSPLAPEDALLQAFSEGVNVALRQRRLGVPCSKIRVPIFSSNGRLVQFGVVLMLEPSFPYLVATSKCLDVCDTVDLEEATLQLARWISQSKSILQTTQTTNLGLVLELSTKLYHMKPLSEFFCTNRTMDSSLLHMFQILELLWHESTREYVLFPITVRSDAQTPALVFPKLDDYKIGLPSDKASRKTVIQKLEVAMGNFHARGVVHMDLYPSNIMWCALSTGGFDLKVIDWDASHKVGELFSESVQERLNDTNRPRLCKPSAIANAEYDTMFYQIIVDNQVGD
jgi:hypothetical protein